MKAFIIKVAQVSAIAGGLVLTALSILMVVSIAGGAIADIGHSDQLARISTKLTLLVQNSGIRTIKGMYEVMEMGIAFVIFSFLPYASLYRGHAEVDLIAAVIPKKGNQFLSAFWASVFLAVMLLITWRLWGGMTRHLSSGMVYQDLQIPQWWGYGVALVQLMIASFVAAYVAYGEWLKLLKDKDVLPETGGAVH